MSLESIIPTKKSYNKTLKEIKYAKLKLIVPILAMIIVMLTGYHQHIEFQRDIDIKEKFICKSTAKDDFKIIIDKKDGWILKDNYFIKENSSISIKRCSPIKEQNNE